MLGERNQVRCKGSSKWYRYKHLLLLYLGPSDCWVCLTDCVFNRNHKFLFLCELSQIVNVYLNDAVYIKYNFEPIQPNGHHFTIPALDLINTIGHLPVGCFCFLPCLKARGQHNAGTEIAGTQQRFSKRKESLLISGRPGESIWHIGLFFADIP